MMMTVIYITYVQCYTYNMMYTFIFASFMQYTKVYHMSYTLTFRSFTQYNIQWYATCHTECLQLRWLCEAMPIPRKSLNQRAAGSRQPLGQDTHRLQPPR